MSKIKTNFLLITGVNLSTPRFGDKMLVGQATISDSEEDGWAMVEWENEKWVEFGLEIEVGCGLTMARFKVMYYSCK